MLAACRKSPASLYNHYQTRSHGDAGLEFQASRDWYVTNFGFEVEFEANDERKTIAIKDDAGFTIFLYQQAAELAGVKCSLTFQVKDVDAKYRELHDHGIAFENPPGKYFWGYGAELRDPDGYLVMLWDEVSMREKGCSSSHRRAFRECHFGFLPPFDRGPEP